MSIEENPSFLHRIKRSRNLNFTLEENSTRFALSSREGVNKGFSRTNIITKKDQRKKKSGEKYLAGHRGE